MSILLRTTALCMIILVTLSFTSHALFGKDQTIILEEVPKSVMDAAKKQLENFMPESAEKEVAKKYIEYEIEGTSNDKRYSISIKVDKSGEIIDIEIEEEDD